jgi:hypothetical protein
MAISNLNNLETFLDTLRADLRKLGTSDGKGAKSRAAAALRMADAARNGEIDEDFAEDGYSTYLEGKRKAIADDPLAGGVDNPGDKGFNQQVSKFRAYIKAGALPAIDGPAILRRSAEIAQELRNAGEEAKAPFDAMLDVARAQIKQKDEPLTEEQMTALVRKAKPADKDDLAKLVAAYKAAYKLAESIPLPGTEAAVTAYRDAITEAGGEVPAMTKEEKAEAEAMAFLRKRGMIATYALAAE